MDKAKIVSISEVDKGGTFFVTYQILDKTGKVLYDNLITSGTTAAAVKDSIKGFAADLKSSLSEAKKISIGEEINL